MVPYFERFLRETDWRVLVRSGDADAAVPFEGTQRWIECLGQPVVEDWDQWFTNDVAYGWQVRKWKKKVIYSGAEHFYCVSAPFTNHDANVSSGTQ